MTTNLDVLRDRINDYANMQWGFNILKAKTEIAISVDDMNNNLIDLIYALGLLRIAVESVERNNKHYVVTINIDDTIDFMKFFEAPEEEEIKEYKESIQTIKNNKRI